MPHTFNGNTVEAISVFLLRRAVDLDAKERSKLPRRIAVSGLAHTNVATATEPPAIQRLALLETTSTHSTSVTAVRFLTRTFRNVLYMFALGNSLFACGVRSARERSFEEVRGETEVGRRLLAPEPRPLPPRTRPAGTQTESQLEPATSAGVIFPKTGQFLLLCLLQLWQQLQRCLVVKLEQGCHCFLYILLPFCGISSPRTTCFFGKRTVTSDRSR